MADKTKSIKAASDKELDELLIRLRKENEVQNLVGDLKRKSTPRDPFGNSISYERPEISTEAPIESLYHEAVENTLKHFGILGMKWGVRRTPGSDGLVSSRSTSSRNYSSEDYKRTRELKKKGVKNLSTKELQEVTKRMNLEKQLRELTVSDYSKGMDATKAILAAGTTIAGVYGLSTTPLGQAIKKKLTG